MKRRWGKTQPRVHSLDWLDWCRRVTDQVSFWPDHPAIRRELLDHLEDSAGGFQRAGFPVPQAQQRALEAMGDPAAIGRALNRVHCPWLGWLWEVSRGLVLALLAIGVWVLLQSGAAELESRTAGQLHCPEVSENAQQVSTETAELFAAPGRVFQENGRTVAEIDFWVHAHSIFQDGPEGALMEIRLRDDRGILYANHRERDADGALQTAGYWESWQSEEQSRDSWDKSWLDYHWIYRVYLDTAPEWLELDYPWGGGWTMRVTWED